MMSASIMDGQGRAETPPRRRVGVVPYRGLRIAYNRDVRLFADLRRMPRWEALVLVGAAAAIGGWWARSWAERAGSIVVTVGPADATVLIDNVKVSGQWPLTIDRAPGPYTLSVTRDGYTRSDLNVEVRAGVVTPVDVKLEPSPDTGFELTSEPPGGLVWLDGKPVMGWGEQARTNFRASRIAPGHHVAEIRVGSFKAWQQEFEIQAGEIRKIHAILIPSRD
jgi:hypothetical protein